MKVLNRLRAAVRTAGLAVDDGLLALRDRLTPGQRWTSALALFVALSVLFFGLPTSLKFVPGRGGAQASAQGSPAQDAAGPPITLPPEVALIPAPAVGAPAAEDDVPIDGGSVSGPSPLPGVVALVRSDSARPGRDDAAIAAAFLNRASFESETVTLGGSAPEVCAQALTKGRVVLASEGLDDDLKSCLVDAGAVVVAFDSAGSSLQGQGGGAVISSRRGLVPSLVDLGRWGLASGALKGRVGVVGASSERPTLEAAIATLTALGVDVRATALVDASGTEPPTSHLRRFIDAGVEVVLFAAPMVVQRGWVVQQSILAPGVRSVVSDAFDAVVDESYPATFDGALAHTSLRVPWFSRAEGETVAQASCKEVWTATSHTLLSEETVPVFAWCQHVAAVGAALEVAARGGVSVRDALRAQSVVSPLTSDLGPLGGEDFGPVADAVLVWRTSCACWAPQAPFATR